MSSANGFLSFLSGYSIFQGCVVSIMTVDYFFVRKGNLSLSDMFSTSPQGRYFYTRGVHLRALAAFVAGFALPLPGFIGSFGTTTTRVGAASTHMFELGWILSYLVGGVVYALICLLSRGREDGEFESVQVAVAVDGLEVYHRQEQEQEHVSIPGDKGMV